MLPAVNGGGGVALKALPFRDAAKTVCILATGPSLNQRDADACRGWPTIVVNDSYRLAPWADLLYACDPEWWRVYLEDVRAKFRGECWSQFAAGFGPKQRARAIAELRDTWGLNLVEGRNGPGLCTEPGFVHYGKSSGYQAVNLAYHKGARRMLLLGFDCGVVGNKRHWFGEHPKALNQDWPLAAWLENFGRLSEDLKRNGVAVVNCAPKSHLTCFPKSTIAQCLAPIS